MPAIEPSYPRLPPAATRETVETAPGASPDNVVKTILLDVSSDLLVIQSSTNILDAISTDRYSPSLQVLRQRLTAGYYAPFPGFTNDNEEASEHCKRATRKKTKFPLMERPLGAFEDLYYAVLAKVKAMHEAIILRLNNGFNDPKAPLFNQSEYTMHSFIEWLLHQWMILNEPSFVLALDNAVRRCIIHVRFHRKVLNRMKLGDITKQELDAIREFESDVLADLPGLSWIGDEHSAMISGRLNEKYRVVFREEKRLQEKRTRWAKKKIRMTRPIQRDDSESTKGKADIKKDIPPSPWRSFASIQAHESTEAEHIPAEKQLNGKTPTKEVQHLDPETQRSAESDGGVAVQVEQHQLAMKQHTVLDKEVSDYGEDGGVKYFRCDLQGSVLRQSRFCQALSNQYKEEQKETFTGPHRRPALPRGIWTQESPRDPDKSSSLSDGRNGAVPQGKTEDRLPSNQEYSKPSDGRRGMRMQRVTDYTDWLRESASDAAKRLVCQSSPGPPTLTEASLRDLVVINDNTQVGDDDC